MSEAELQSAAAEIGALLERRRLAQAKTRLSTALQRFPEDLELLLQSAWADYLSDDNAEAMVTVQQVLARAPESDAARLLLFELRLDAGDLSEAERLIIDLLKDNPEDANLYARYAHVMLRAMQFEKARALAEEGRRFEPDDSDCLAVETLCDFVEKRHGATSAALQQLLARDPDRLGTLILIAQSLEDRGDYAGSYRIVQELVRAQPDHPGFVEAAAELKATTHWSMLPMWPMKRWGWGASIGIWLGAMILIRGLAETQPIISFTIAIIFILYALYSWIWPRLLRRWMKRV